MADVIDVANYILEISREPCPDGEYDIITHMKLQKLAYFCQGHFLAFCGRPLFRDPIEAWEHGPVCPELYRLFRDYGSFPLTTSINPQRIALDDDEKRFIGMVYDAYKVYSASGLRNLTHREGPWKSTPQNAVITPDAMLGYFEPLTEANPADIPPFTEAEKCNLVSILEKAEADGGIDLSRFSVAVGA